MKDVPRAEPIRAIYGLEPAHPLFRRGGGDAILKWVQRHRFNAVFGGHQDRALVATLRQQGIKVFAEVALFVGQRHWRTHPASRPITAAGRPLRKRGWYSGVCPNQPWLQTDRLAQITRLVRRHRPDGVWLDFIRYPARWEGRRPLLEQTCFCPACLGLMEREAGIRPPASARGVRQKAAWILEHRLEPFVDWKCRRITDFCRRARAAVRRAGSNVTLGLFAVPWRAGDHGGAIRAVLGQDFRRLAAHVDIFSPMVYHRMVGQTPAWVASFTGHLQRLTRRPVLPVVQACSLPDRLPAAELTRAVRAALQPPSAGVAVFSFKHFVKERRSQAWLEALG